MVKPGSNKNSGLYPKTRLLAHIYMGLCLVSVLLMPVGSSVLWELLPGACIPFWSCYMLYEDITYLSVLFPMFGMIVFPLLLIASYIVLLITKRPHSSSYPAGSTS